MRTEMISVVVISMLVALTFFPWIQGQAQGEDPAQVLGHVDFGLSVDEDPLFEYLVFNFTLSVSQPGKYLIIGSLLYNGEHHLVVNDTVKELEVGIQNILVYFSSTPIYKNGKDGYFVYDYSIRYEDGLPYLDALAATSTYGYMEFDDPSYELPTLEKYQPTSSKESEHDRIIIKNDIITVRFYYNDARFEWFYTRDNKSLTKYNCQYTMIHGYIDDGSGRYTTGNAIYTGVLSERGGIRTSGPTEGKSKLYGEFVSYSVTYSNVPIKTSNVIERLANVTISMLLAAGDRTVDIANKDYLIMGGTQLKVEFFIDLGSSLSIDGLAIEHEIWTESSKGYYHDFVFEDNHYTKIARESKNPNDFKFNWIKDPRKISFIPKYAKDKSEEGYHFWMSKGKVNGVGNDAPMTYQYMPEKKHLRLDLAVKTSGLSMTTIEAHTGIGLNEGSNPSEKNFIPPEEPAPPSILVTIAGWMSAIFLVILPLWIDFRRAKRKLQELEEEYGEEL